MKHACSYKLFYFPGAKMTLEFLWHRHCSCIHWSSCGGYRCAGSPAEKLAQEVLLLYFRVNACWGFTDAVIDEMYKCSQHFAALGFVLQFELLGLLPAFRYNINNCFPGFTWICMIAVSQTFQQEQGAFHAEVRGQPVNKLRCISVPIICVGQCCHVF